MRQRVAQWDGYRARAAEIADLAPLAAEDAAVGADLEHDLADLEREVERASLEAQLSGPYEQRDAVVTISAGVGGTLPVGNRWRLPSGASRLKRLGSASLPP